MKVISDQYFSILLEDIIRQKKDETENIHKTFNGITGDELHKEITRRLGEDWMIDSHATKLTTNDINAVANSRFFRQSGQRMLLVTAIILVGLSLLVRYIPNMTQLYYNIAYVLVGLIALGLIYVYSRKQAKVRREIKWQLGITENKDNK